MQILWIAGWSSHFPMWLWKEFFAFTLSGHFADPLSNVRKTFGSTSYLSLTDEMMENRSSFELQAQPKHVSVILCSGVDPECALLKLKRNTRPLSCALRKKSGGHPATPALELSFCLFLWLPRVDTALHCSARDRLLFLCTFGFAHAFSRNTTRFYRSCKFLCPISKAAVLQPSHQLRHVCLHTATHHSALYNLHHCMALKSDVTGKQVAGRFDSTARFFRRINLERTTTTCHVLVLKGLATSEHQY